MWGESISRDFLLLLDIRMYKIRHFSKFMCVLFKFTCVIYSKLYVGICVSCGKCMFCIAGRVCTMRNGVYVLPEECLIGAVSLPSVL
jgi:ferredoxin